MKKAISLFMATVLVGCVFCASFSTLAAVASSVWGDVNGDKSVNMKDILALRKALAGLTVLENAQAGDVNYDGSVNMKDVLYLRKFLAHIVTEPERPSSGESTADTTAVPTTTATATSTTLPTTTPTAVIDSGEIDSPIILWEGDVNQQVTITNTIGFIQGDIGKEIDAAIQQDLAENGIIGDHEYYEIIIDGYSSGPSGYATGGLFVDDGSEYGIQIWPNNSEAGYGTVTDKDGTYRQKIDALVTDRWGKPLISSMNQTSCFAVYSDGFSEPDFLTIRHLTIQIYRDSPLSNDPAVYSKYYRYNEEGKPVINFRSPADDSTLGTWWWFPEDSEDSECCDKYLDFLEENGVSEIFYYGYPYLGSSSGEETLHAFVSKANSRGMAVSLIYDNKDVITTPGNTEMTTIADRYLHYVHTYPTDQMNGIHFDVEGVSPQVYADTMISQFAAARERGVKIAVDVHCTLRGSCTLNGISGIYNVICANVDCISLMSYRDTANAIWQLGLEAYTAAMQYGTKILFGVETGAYDFNDPSMEFAQENKEYCYTALGKVYDRLCENHPAGGFGVALHYQRDWYTLPQADI